MECSINSRNFDEVDEKELRSVRILRVRVYENKKESSENLQSQNYLTTLSLLKIKLGSDR